MRAMAGFTDGVRTLYAKAVVGGNQPTLDPFNRTLQTLDADGNEVPESQGNLHVHVEVAGGQNVLFKSKNNRIHHTLRQYNLEGVYQVDMTMHIGVDQKGTEVDYVAAEQHHSIGSVNEIFVFTKNADLRGQCETEVQFAVDNGMLVHVAGGEEIHDFTDGRISSNGEDATFYDHTIRRNWDTDDIDYFAHFEHGQETQLSFGNAIHLMTAAETPIGWGYAPPET